MEKKSSIRLLKNIDHSYSNNYVQMDHALPLFLNTLKCDNDYIQLTMWDLFYCLLNPEEFR